nr:hypothetical protein [Kibdelosporangium sp. MJ126-NF4]CEL14848.1 hypothetical protein [Kibdelosporangium sp. MJ126-NF4]CTQ96521.1 hypothetical protein [Kibdelosporangium sp. MJ126-NF4]
MLPDRQTIVRLDFRQLVGYLDDMRIAEFERLGPLERGGHYDWLVLVERYPEKFVAACDELTDDELRHSAELADSVFRAAETYGGQPARSMRYARFNLSASLMRELSPRPGFPFLDPDELLRDYLAALPVTLAEAKEGAWRVRTLDKVEILKLRDPKWLMIPLKMVDHLFRDSPELDEYRKWKGIWADLP